MAAEPRRDDGRLGSSNYHSVSAQVVGLQSAFVLLPSQQTTGATVCFHAAAVGVISF
jgi:hypothetical protein